MRAETPCGFVQHFDSLAAYEDSWMWANSRTRYEQSGAPMVCFICGEDYEIELHHRSYQHVGREQPHELVPLCESHHRMVERLVRGRWASRWEAHLLLEHRLALRQGGDLWRFRAHLEAKRPELFEEAA
jgi:hypothetical protein